MKRATFIRCKDHWSRVHLFIASNALYIDYFTLCAKCLFANRLHWVSGAQRVA